MTTLTTKIAPTNKGVDNGVGVDKNGLSTPVVVTRQHEQSQRLAAKGVDGVDKNGKQTRKAHDQTAVVAPGSQRTGTKTAVPPVSLAIKG